MKSSLCMLMLTMAMVISAKAEEQNKNSVFFNLSLNSKDKLNYITETGKEKDTHDRATGFGIKYLRDVKQLDNYTLSLGLYFQSEDEGGVIAKNQDVTYATGGKVRMVKTQTTIEEQRLGSLIVLSYDVKIHENWSLRPFAGAGLGLGQSEAKAEIMTDKKNPTLFSTHNRYHLGNKKDFYQTSLSLGSSLEINHWSFILEGTLQKTFAIKSQNIAADSSADNVTFDNSDYRFADTTLNRAMVQIGLGYKF